jgi:hypothetical protein
VVSGECVETVVLTGGETYVCVVAAATAQLISDTAWSFFGTHASLELLGDRFSVQFGLVTIDEFLRTL